GKTSDSPLAQGTTIDAQIRAVRQGWLPCYPQFNKSSFEVANEAKRAGLDAGAYVASQMKAGRLKFTMEDPDAPENWPRMWFIWRGNAIGTSAKGHEYFMKHYLGTHSSAITEEVAGDAVKEVVWHKDAPIGKMDLIVDLNFRMDTSALYSDIILPAATWYEKNDLNSTDMHTFMNPLQQVVPPAWESRSDWDIFKAVAEKVSELSGKHFPEPVMDVVSRPLSHDTVDELAQPTVKDWKKGECEPIPGKTMPHFTVVERDYVNLFNRYVSLGPGASQQIGAHGLSWDVSDVYDRLRDKSSLTWGNQVYPSLYDAVEVADMILAMAPETNGEMAYRAFKAEEAKTGLKLTDLAEDHRDVCLSFKDLIAQPRRQFTSPIWSGIINDGRAYSPYTLNVDKLVPWRTITGRQQFYIDHEVYLAFGEHLPTFKSKLDSAMLGETEKSRTEDPNSLLLNYITPHGKWSIHSTYSDNHRMMTLSRGGYPIWLNHKDAAKLGVKDNDWIEAYNDNGVFVCRCIVSSRIPSGTAFLYHATERTVSVPKTQMRNKKRGGMNNSLTRARLKPVLMAGGYGQFTFAFNYWGPTGVNRDTFVFVRRVEQPDW
ncbi:MAG: molybdopterin-dependent oxidoreductase, partial [Candidatus Sericytochromatia bacterium]